MRIYRSLASSKGSVDNQGKKTTKRSQGTGPDNMGPWPWNNVIMSYNTSISSILEYGTKVWSPEINDTCWSKMQTIQNAALRIATGDFLKASIPHLHRETKVLSLRNHSRLLSYQCLAASHLPWHPGREHLGKEHLSLRRKSQLSSPYQPNSPRLQDSHQWTLHWSSRRNYQQIPCKQGPWDHPARGQQRGKSAPSYWIFTIQS